MSQNAPAPAGDVSSTAPTSLAYVAVRIPPYWGRNSGVWFIQAETPFQLAGITSQQTMYRHIVASLPPDVATEVMDILQNPPTDSPYKALRDGIIERTSLSERKRLQQLLTAGELGDRCPRQLLRSMQALLGDRAATFDIKVLRELFLQRMPQQMQMILASTAGLPLAGLAQLADNITDIASPALAAIAPPRTDIPSPYQPQTPIGADITSQLSTMAAEIRRLCDAVAALQPASPHRARCQRSRSRTRRSSPFTRASSRQQTLCWYHARHGVNAHRYITPCTWAENNHRDL